MRYSIDEIAGILELSVRELVHPKAMVSYLLTDSRLLTFPDETLFFAVRTVSSDCHRYVGYLYERGVRNFVVERVDKAIEAMGDANFLVVPDALAALHKVATFHRRRFDIPVIAITGSRGKTSVKEWLYQLLREDYSIVRSPRNVNPQISVPLTLWEIDDGTSLAIIEAGITRPGEMAELQTTIRPTIGIFTNLGSLHREGFATKRLKAQEKASLLTACECIIYSEDDPIIAETVEPILAVAQDIAWSYQNPEASLFISEVERGQGETRIGYFFKGVPGDITIPFTTDAEISNAVTCLAVLLYMEVDTDVITERMSHLTKVGTRLNLMEGVNDCMLIADTSTSDFNSIANAVDFVARRQRQGMSSTVILSDVSYAPLVAEDVYRAVASMLSRKHIQRFVGIGREISEFGYLFGVDAQFYETTEAFLEQVSQSDFENEMVLVKGAPEFGFDRIIDLLDAKQNQTVLEVSLDAVVHNYNYFRSLLPPTSQIVCMVKASAYGAGIYELAKTLQEAGAPYLAVAVHDEGVELRKAGITMPIMVLNPRIVNYRAMFSYELEPEVYSLDGCREIIREAEKYGVTDYPIHIKIDSGMHRLGMLREDMEELVTLLRGQGAIKPASVFTHLCAADDPLQDEYTLEQFKYFDDCCDVLQQAFSYHIKRHALNTAGMTRFADHAMDLTRLGIGLYGIGPTEAVQGKLRPVSALHTVIISIKEWPAGTTIGYNRRGELTRRSMIATIPVGYADGIDRHLGNGNASFYVNGTLCPTVGNICMDLCMIDVTDAVCKVGDRVEIFGQHIPVTKLAETLGTIAYEILTSVSHRVKRVYFRE